MNSDNEARTQILTENQTIKKTDNWKITGDPDRKLASQLWVSCGDLWLMTTICDSDVAYKWALVVYELKHRPTAIHTPQLWLSLCAVCKIVTQ